MKIVYSYKHKVIVHNTVYQTLPVISKRQQFRAICAPIAAGY